MNKFLRSQILDTVANSEKVSTLDICNSWQFETDARLVPVKIKLDENFFKISRE